MTDKPKRLAKLEDRWRDDGAGTVEFDNGFSGEWMVYVSVHILPVLTAVADVVSAVLVKALKAANKAGKL